MLTLIHASSGKHCCTNHCVFNVARCKKHKVECILISFLSVGKLWEILELTVIIISPSYVKNETKYDLFVFVIQKKMYNVSCSTAHIQKL